MMSANLHFPASAEAHYSGDTTWLTIKGIRGDQVTIFMPLDTASRMAEAFSAQPAPDLHPEDFDDGNITP
jgi:hypothetical protein